MEMMLILLPGATPAIVAFFKKLGATKGQNYYVKLLTTWNFQVGEVQVVVGSANTRRMSFSLSAGRPSLGA